MKNLKQSRFTPHCNQFQSSSHCERCDSYLESGANGDPNAASELLPLVYGELRKLAAARMANEGASHTLQPTALVHEAWMRLTDNDPNTQFANRAHFFAVAAEAMRRILIDRARRKSADKRGGDWKRID